jgi:hypothetical protein
MSFTRVPNKVIDELRLNPYQFQVLSIIVRKTDGWCKLEDGISLSQFEKLVTFSKPKIVSTIKELEEIKLITKIKNYDEATKRHSFTTYRMHQGVVNEVNKGSKPDLQGVVNEVNKQKKLTTKETNTNPYDLFLKQVKEKVSIKSKVTKTKEGKELFDKIENKDQLLKSYVNHQLEKKEFAQRLTAYMMDYNPTTKDLRAVKQFGKYTG